MLTEEAIRAARPRGRDYKMGDIPGLYVRVAKSGAKTFHLRVTVNRRRITERLGTFPGMSLQEAREQALRKRLRIKAKARGGGRLTDGIIRAAQPKDKRYHMFDAGGLHVTVTEKGTKAFYLQMTVNGRRKRVYLGRFPDMPVAQARAAAARQRALVGRGAPPARRKPAYAGVTDEMLAGMAPPAKPVLLHVDKHLYLRAGVSGTKIWKFMRTARKSGPVGSITITLGAYPGISIARARAEHRRLLGLVRAGCDPRYTQACAPARPAEAFNAADRKCARRGMQGVFTAAARDEGRRAAPSGSMFREDQGVSLFARGKRYPAGDIYLAAYQAGGVRYGVHLRKPDAPPFFVFDGNTDHYRETATPREAWEIIATVRAAIEAPAIRVECGAREVVLPEKEKAFLLARLRELEEAFAAGASPCAAPPPAPAPAVAPAAPVRGRRATSCRRS